MSEEIISKYVIDLRLRNRYIDVIEILADGNDAVAMFGFSGYFNWFFDYFPGEGEFAPLDIMSPEETTAATEVLALMLEACDSTPNTMTEEQFIATGWPERIQPIAQQAMAVFMLRGRLSAE